MKILRVVSDLRNFQMNPAASGTTVLRAVKFLSLCFFLSIFAACTTSEKVDTSTPDGAFKQAEQWEKDERYEEAIAKFTEVKNKYPYSRLATQAELKIADVHYKREAFAEAASAYQLFKEFHPKHPQSDYVTFRLAESYFSQLPSTIDRDLSIADKAILYYDEVMNSYATSSYAADAKKKREEALKMLAQKEMYIANFYAKRENWDSAMRRFEGVLKQYPNLGYDSEALYGAARSAFKSGEKERAQQHLRNLQSLYPNTDEARRAKNELE